MRWRATFCLTISAALMVSLSGCVTQPAGTAVVETGQPGQLAFEGLLAPEPVGTVRHIFVTHGMGPTQDDFANIVLSRLTKEAGFTIKESWSKEGDWIPIRLPEAVQVEGEALRCEPHQSLPPCAYAAFGGLKVDKLTDANGNVVFVYRYFWDRDLRLIEEPFIANDNQVERSKIIGGLKLNLINYGFTDAAAYLGPLGGLLRTSAEGAICTMMKHASGAVLTRDEVGPCSFADLDPAIVPPSAKFSFISQSLGSRLLFDTLTPAYNRLGGCTAAETAAKRSVLTKTDSFFMLANQLPLLALGQVAVRPAAQPHFSSCDPGLSGFVEAARPTGDANGQEWPTLPPLQIVSFQDPEDLLGFRFTNQLANADNGRLRVVQVSHRNTSVRGIFGSRLGSNPKVAHATELSQNSAAKLIFCGAKIQGAKQLVPASDCLAHEGSGSPPATRP